MLPSGLRDHLPARAEALRRLDSAFLDFFAEKGYRYLITPLFERIETFEKAFGSNGTLQHQRQMFRALDPHRGELVAFRPDILPQIARLVATRLTDWELPIRLCYSGRVVRADDEPGALTREIFQVGCELMGDAGIAADAELVTMAANSLRKAGLKRFKIDLGHIEFVRGILEEAFPKSSGEGFDAVIEALRRRDISTLEPLLKTHVADAKVRAAILELPSLFGGAEVFKNAAALVFNERSKSALADLKKCFELLSKKGLEADLAVDLGEIRGFHYYTGIMIQAFAKECGRPLLSGGRYDSLLQKFGRDLPATGFATDLEVILETLEKQKS